MASQRESDATTQEEGRISEESVAFHHDIEQGGGLADDGGSGGHENTSSPHVAIPSHNDDLEAEEVNLPITAASSASASNNGTSSASINKQGPSVGANTASFRIQVPPNVKPGEEFQVYLYACSKIAKVRCPPNTRPGQSLLISVPIDPGERNGSGTFRVQVPPNVKPGEEFQVYAGSKIVKVRCPPNTRPGQSLQISVPVDPGERNGSGSSSSAATAGGGGGGSGGSQSMMDKILPDIPPDSDNVTIKIPNQTLAPGEMPAYIVKIPEGVRGGTQFPVTINGQQLMVTCPQMARHPMWLRIVPPPPPKNGNNSNNINAQNGQQGGGGGGTGGGGHQQRRRRLRLVYPLLPSYLRSLSCLRQKKTKAAGKSAKENAVVSVAIHQMVWEEAVGRNSIFIPNRLVNPKFISELAEIRLSYDKDGWTRTIRATDMKFQWTRFDTDGNVDTLHRFDTERSAYVCKLEWEGDDDRMRKGRVSLVTPDRGVVDSKVESADGRVLVTFQEIVTAQNKSYYDKIEWLEKKCWLLYVLDEGRVRMRVRRDRDYLLSDSMEAVMSLSRKDLRKVWSYEWIGEGPPIDMGGAGYEWFEYVTDEVFDPDMGLWQTSATNQMCMQINPASETSCPGDHLIYFRFIGRVMGKSMLFRLHPGMGLTGEDRGGSIDRHMVKHLYKHILGWPIMFNDLKDIDEKYYNWLKGLKDMGADVEHCCIDFTVVDETLGVKQTVELVPNGASIAVTEENLPEYIEACLKYRMLGRYEAQLNELLLGFFDVIPEPLLTIFDFQELELLMCGLPQIEMEDWKRHTEYSGEYDRDGPNHEVCLWFWEVVSEYDQEMKARLLQFVTGTSGVPAKGFGSLQGNDGNVRKFTIHGVTLETCVYPRSHTCFNRIDLPLYEDKSELEEKLKIAITMAATGFDIE